MKPFWDVNRHELWFEEALVKRLRTPACCQEVILGAFEEDGWPAWIDDPLPYVPGISAKRRLHNAINCLNRAHLVRAIKFHGDGTGTKIVWTRET